MRVQHFYPRKEREGSSEGHAPDLDAGPRLLGQLLATRQLRPVVCAQLRRSPQLQMQTMIEPHPAQLEASAWAADATLAPAGKGSAQSTRATAAVADGASMCRPFDAMVMISACGTEMRRAAGPGALRDRHQLQLTGAVGRSD